MSGHDQAQGPLDPHGPGGIDAPAPPGGPQRTDAPAGAAGPAAAGSDADPVHDDAGPPPRGRPADDTGVTEPGPEDAPTTRQQDNAGTTGDEPSH